jgi:hypothetical protein
VTVLGRLALVAALVAISACGGSPVTPDPIATSSSTRTPSTPRPTPIERSDAKKEALVRETIGLLFCDEQPRSDWCQWLRRDDGQAVVKVKGTNLTVAVRSATPVGLAEQLCRDLAYASFDDKALLIGYVTVDVEAGPSRFIAECFVP